LHCSLKVQYTNFELDVPVYTIRNIYSSLHLSIYIPIYITIYLSRAELENLDEDDFAEVLVPAPPDGGR